MEQEDTLEMYEAKEKARKEGWWDGMLMGFPLGFFTTVLIAWLTIDEWIILIK